MARLANRIFAAAAILPLAALVLAPAPAHAQWRGGHGGYGGYGGYHRGYYGPRGIGPGIVGGALLGLGVGALLAAPYAVAPPVAYAPPPAYYPPPAYAYAPPGYYAPAPYPY